MIQEFEYFAPKKLKEALKLMDKYGEDCKVICGGQSLLILMRQGLLAPSYLIDIKGLTELEYIKNDPRDGLRIGAITTHRTIEKSAVVKKAFPVVAEMEKRLASIQTRNRGSIGGNLCHGDPAGDPAPVLMALDATLKLAGLKAERSVKIEDFYKDYFETVMEHGELLTEVQVPAAPPHTGTAYTKFNIIESDMATVGVAVSVTLGARDNVCKDVRIALGACASKAMRATKAEQVLRANKITEKLLAEAGEVAVTETDPISDIHASADYRRDLVRVLVKRVATEAVNRANQAQV